MNGTFTILDHPSDLGIEAVGGTLEKIFEAAARGLMSVILDPASVGCIETREVRLKGTSHEQLLVRWLSEVLYLYDGEHFAAKEFTIRSLTTSALVAEISGERCSREHHKTRLDVKAVTYHQLAITKSGRKFTARVFLDI
jgi:SHS2 domain-containing protein